ncbi:MAG: hypothetical protein KF704_06985 [Crocinitomicaceae bacterium]|nr:hypothetical protein [Crocinitomicaceae bacterium]NGF76063.1 hypothetical protein [Fluviicola sp. SGL-29]
MNKSVQTSYYFIFLFVFTYVIIRAAVLGITHDEALTYQIINGDEAYRATANNHWLNTQLSTVVTSLFGAKEFFLRLPNVLFFVVFWWFLYRIAKQFVSSSYMQLTLLFFLCCNPFLLDFFSLCRGYGISVACSVASVYYLLKIVNLQERATGRDYLLTSLFSVFALSANLNTLNYFLIAQGVLLVFFIRWKPQNRLKWILILSVICVASLYISLEQLFFLKNKNELYFGTNRFISTIDNMLYSGFYTLNPFRGIEFMRYALFSVLLIACFAAIRNRKLYSVGTVLLIVVFLIVSGLILEHYLFDALYPTNRTSLYMYPILVLAIVLNLDAIRSKITNLLLLTCSVAYVFINLSAINFSKTVTWAEDQHVKQAVLRVKKDIQDREQHTLSASWIYKPIINYYRREYGIPVTPVVADGVTNESEYIITQQFVPLGEGITIDGTHILLDHRQECGLALRKRKNK